MPAATLLTHSGEEHYDPALAQSGDNVYVAYVQFTHGDRALEERKAYAASVQSAGAAT